MMPLGTVDGLTAMDDEVFGTDMGPFRVEHDALGSLGFLRLLLLGLLLLGLLLLGFLFRASAAGRDHFRYSFIPSVLFSVVVSVGSAGVNRHVAVDFTV